MNNCTIISYSGLKNNNLLSLVENRSRYMLPFGGKFRIIDFTLRNSFFADAAETIIYSDSNDDLNKYVNKYGSFNDESSPSIKVITKKYSDITFTRNLIINSDSNYFVIYNGDNPSIIDFTKVLQKFKKTKSHSLLLKLFINDKPSMAHKILITKKNALLKIIDSIIKDKIKSVNIFEIIINKMINRGIKQGSFKTIYWPINNIPEYYNLTRKIIWDEEIFNLLFHEKIIQSQIKAEGYAIIGEQSNIKNSFLSDYCKIDGHVENSIIYPGVEIASGAFIKDSIILPFVKIGEKARIYKSIIDETTNLIDDIDEENNFRNIEDFNIGNRCHIGTDEESLKNNDFSKSLFSSITLIGKNCKIPDETKIGGACYISSDTNESSFEKSKNLHDGLSIVK